MLPFSHHLVLHDRIVEFGRREVIVGEERHRLSPLEAAALAYLAERPGQPISREELLREVWGYAPQVRSRAADITISRLRQQIEADPRRPQHLLTVRGVGYRFIPPHAEAPASPPAPAPAPKAPSGVPPRPLGELVGRAAELAALQGASARLLVLQGPPGVGKTRLALAHAEVLVEQSSVVWWCALAEVRTVEGFEEAVAQALGVPLSEESDDASEQIGYALAGRGAGTLMLDTFEHLPAACGAGLARWLRQAPRLRAVVTSRRRLGVPGEQLVQLAPLPPEDAAALFRSRAQQVGVDTVTPEEAARLAEALDGVPLAIELAAARSAMFSPEQLLARLDEPLSVLRRAHPLDPRHASLEGALSWSWELLGPAEQAALAQVTVFRGGFTAAAAEAVLDLPDGAEPLEVLSALVDHSLIAARLDVAPRRFRLSAAIRQFAAAKLDAPGDVAGRHAAHIAAWAAGELARAETRGLTQALPRLRAERENLLAVQRTTADPLVRAQVTLALLEVPPSRRPTAAARALLAAALGDDLPAPVRGRLLAHRAALAVDAGELEAAEADLGAAAPAAEGDDALWIAVGRQRCRALLKAARWAEAEAVAEACSARARQLGAREARFIALLDQAFSTFMRYDLDQTELLLQQAKLLFPDPLQTRWGGRLMTVLSAVYRGQGRLDEAIAARRESLRLYRHHHDPINAANALMDLSRYHFYLHGTPDDAAWSEAERLCRELGERRLESHFLEQAAHLAVDAGRCAEAEATLRRFRAISAGHMIEARREFTYFFLLTLIRLQQRRYAEAVACAAEARAGAGSEVPQFVLLGDIASGLAAIFSGQRGEGRGFLLDAVSAARARGVQEVVYALCYLAVLEADDGRPDAAAAALAEAGERLRETDEPVQDLLHQLCYAWAERDHNPALVSAALAAASAGNPPPVSTSVDLRLMADRLRASREPQVPGV